MKLKNLMDDKQLDFNQPLLSVKRSSSATTALEAADARTRDSSLAKIPPLPAYKSELKSGPVGHPGTVPFVWEQMPGRPKYESKTLEVPPRQLPSTPKLPPGRIQNNEQKNSEGQRVKQSQMSNVPSSHLIASSLNSSVNKEERFQEMGSSDSDNDEAYLDALDALSRTESSFFNCSLSGLSGIDAPEVSSCEMFSRDARTGNFMMDRFLPAAKAMASESPQYTSTKQVVAEPSKEVIKVVTVVKHYSVEQHLRKDDSVEQRRQKELLHRRKDLLSHMQKEVQESDSESENYEEPDYLSMKVCGLFPRFCVKGSFCLMSPLPGLRMQGEVPISSGHSAQARTTHANSSSGTEKERSRGGHSKADLSGAKLIRTSDNKRLDGSYCNQSSQSYQEKGFSKVPERGKHSRDNGIDSKKKRRSSFRELLARETAECEPPPVSPVAEKTLYIDSVNTAISHNAIASVLCTKKELANCEVDNCDTFGKNKETTMNSSSLDTELNMVDANMGLSPKILPSAEPCFMYSAQLNHENKLDVTKSSAPEPNLFQDSTFSELSLVPNNGKIELEDNFPEKADKGSSYGLSSHLSLPPLPNTPSESWLKRTLPTVSRKNLSSMSSIVAGNDVKIQVSKPFGGPKWETIVRTSNVHHNHTLFSQELLTPIPEA